MLNEFLNEAKIREMITKIEGMEVVKVHYEKNKAVFSYIYSEGILTIGYNLVFRYIESEKKFKIDYWSDTGVESDKSKTLSDGDVKNFYFNFVEKQEQLEEKAISHFQEALKGNRKLRLRITTGNIKLVAFDRNVILVQEN